MGFFQGYGSTEGPDRFPREQRFHVWRAAHKRLKASDASYRARCRNFFIINSIVVTPIFCLTCLGLGSLRDFGIFLIATAIYVPYILVVSFRQQRWMNAKIAEEIKTLPA